MKRTPSDATSSAIDASAPSRADGLTRRAVAAGLAAIAALAAAASAHAVVPPASRPSLAATVRTAAPTTVTLLSGDRVQLDAQGNVLRIEPGAGRRSVLFTQTRSRGETSVIPSDALPLIQRGVVDPRLFNVSLLVKYGYDDARRGTLPAIARGFDGGAETMRSAGMQAPRALGVLRGFSGAVDKRRANEFWTVIARRGANATTTARFGPRVWLDGLRQPLLDKSVPQIGGPVAWAAGFTGKGVTVAVLDTGLDATHPDFAGRIAVSQNFTTDANTNDNVGHGTHVTSIIAGSGAASGGLYKGVAPDATIAVGKVCSDFGCADSDIIAGMQWAAQVVHARVANMSLGGPGAPGIDPVEEALDTLSTTDGTLFVVAAGNDGCPAQGGSVESPGTAPAALTVGAIDRSAQMASFSSCGPGQGDGAVKPEITGPGVNIVAARSSTGQFPPTDPSGYYTTLSGTSMATPHVAGSAVLVAQQHPGWAGADIKGLLIATADRSNPASLYSQGAGLVNVGAAVQRTWYDAAGNLTFGLQAWPHRDDPVLVRQLVLRNTASQAVNLTLSLEAVSTTGVKAPPGMFTLGSQHVSVPAGGSVNVSLTADTRVNVADGVYAGSVSISDGQANSTTLFSVTKEVESYNLALTHLDPSGQPSTTYQTYVDGLDVDQYWVAPASTDGQATLRLPKGNYRVTTFYPTTSRVDVLVAPQVDLDRNLALTVDARRTAPWQITLPDTALEPDFRLYEAVSWNRPFGMSSIANYSFGATQQLRFGRIEVPGTGRVIDDFAFNAMAELTRHDADGQVDVSHPIVYVAESVRGQMPRGLAKTYAPGDLATLHTDVPRATAATGFYASVRPVIAGGLASGAGFYGPNRRGFIDFQVNAGPYLAWSSELYLQSGQTYEQIGLAALPTAALPGTTADVDWTSVRPYGSTLASTDFLFNLGVATPDLVRGDPASQPGAGLRRGGSNGQDMIALDLQVLGDARGDVGTLSAFTPNALVFSLARAGVPLYQFDASNYGSVQVQVPSGAATYTLTTDTTTPVAFGGALGLPQRSTTEWTFTSGAAQPDAWTALPMSVVRLGALSSAGSGWQIPLRVLRQATGAPVPDAVQSLSVELSTDGGSTWKAAALTGTGSEWTASVPRGAFAQRSLSVRMVAVSKDGAQVRQTVIGAYAAPARSTAP